MKDLLRWSLYPLAFVPVLVDSTVLFPFIFPKTLLVRAVVAIFWAIFAAWLFMDRKRASEVIRERWRFIKNPVFLFTIGFFVVLMFLSTIFAVDSYRAFFGEIERGEGFLGIASFIGFFVASLLVFEKKDWLNFFKLSLVTGAILFIDALGEFMGDTFIRAQSFLGNPTFLAAVFLFVIFSALIVLFSRPTTFWKLSSLVMVILGVVGVFLTGTRGAILGLLFGTMLVVIYFAAKGKDIKISIPVIGEKISLRTVGVSLILVGLFLGTGLFVTRDNPVWENVPGIGRFVGISLQDATLQTRLISAGVSLDAVNPKNEGVGRLLIGYGPENFDIAYNKYYNPEYMRYEPLWFDRAHNKIFDVLVMNGVLGIFAYFGIWISLIYIVFRRIKEKEIGYAAAILFFSGAYFVQNLFVFDQISTYIPFLSLFAFSIFIGSDLSREDKRGDRVRRIIEKTLPYVSGAFAVFLVVTLVLYTFIPYRQTKIFIDALRSGDPAVMLTASENFLEPYNFVQKDVRGRFLGAVLEEGAGDPQFVKVIDRAVEAHEEYIAREPYYPRDITLLANIYNRGAPLGRPELFDAAEDYYLRALELSPARQEHLYSIAITHADQDDFDKMQEYLDIMMEQSSAVPRTRLFYGNAIFQEGENRYDESMDVLNSVLTDPDSYFNNNEILTLRTVYGTFVGYYFDNRDEERFLMALDGSKRIELLVEDVGIGGTSERSSKMSIEFEQLINNFNKVGWDAINL